MSPSNLNWKCAQCQQENFNTDICCLRCGKQRWEQLSFTYGQAITTAAELQKEGM